MSVSDVMFKAFELAQSQLDNYKRVHIGNEAACVVIINDNGEVLAASRRGKPTEFGLPGGKVDNGETLLEGALREVYEETGIQLQADQLHHLITDDDGHGFVVTTFVCVEEMPSDCAVQREADITVKWVDPQMLIDGPFGDYNTRVLEALADYIWNTIP